MPRREVTIGEKHHDLTLLGEEPRDKHGHRMIRVACDCGKETVIRLSSLGKQKTCGSCPKDNIKEHRFYRTWQNMKARCYCENAPNYKDYGGRGIKVQSSWINNSRAFCEYLDSLDHAGEPGYTMDRIDNDGNYEEGNLRFAACSEQNLNKRIQKNNTSGVKGVSWHNSTGKWLVQYRGKHIGYFTEFEDAVKVRIKAEQEDS